MLSWIQAFGVALAVISIPGLPTLIICKLVPQGNEAE